MTRSRRFFASSPWIATGTPDYVNLGYTSRDLAKQALMRLSPKSLAIFRKLGLETRTALGPWEMSHLNLQGVGSSRNSGTVCTRLKAGLRGETNRKGEVPKNESTGRRGIPLDSLLRAAL